MIETARLPPIYSLVPLGIDADPLERARAMAKSGADPATILCADRDDVLDCALILQPDAALQVSRLVIYVGMLGLGDALGSVVPAGIDVTYRWPNRIDANMGAVGRLGLAVPAQTTADAVPPWMVLHALVAISTRQSNGPGGVDFETTLAEEGAVEVTAPQLLESFSRHFLTWMGRWQDDGFAPVRAMWLHHATEHGEELRVPAGGGQMQGKFREIDDDGALLLDDGGTTRRIPLDSVLDA